MTTGPGFEGPQGQFQISLIGAVETGCGLCNPFDPFPTESTFGYLDSFTLTSPSGLQYTGSAEATGFDDPGMCPLHASDIAWGSKVLLHGHVVGDPSLTAEIEVLTCSPLRFSPV
jgi:hypothetical protein